MWHYNSGHEVNCNTVNLIIYCVKMIDRIIGEGKYHVITKLSNVFGKDNFWNHNMPGLR